MRILLVEGTGALGRELVPFMVAAPSLLMNITDMSVLCEATGIARRPDMPATTRHFRAILTR